MKEIKNWQNKNYKDLLKICLYDFMFNNFIDNMDK